MVDSERPDAPDTIPTWDDATLAELRAYGTERDVAAGEVLLRSGQRATGFYVVLAGELEVVRPPTSPSGSGRSAPDSSWAPSAS